MADMNAWNQVYHSKAKNGGGALLETGIIDTSDKLTKADGCQQKGEIDHIISIHVCWMNQMWLILVSLVTIF